MRVNLPSLSVFFFFVYNFSGNLKRSLESSFKYDARGGSPPSTHVRTLLKVTFHSAIPLPDATALAIPRKLSQPKV